MYDVIIIGAGVSGATISRELARYNIKVLILDKEFDVATETTMANSAIIHSGHDPKPGTLKAKFNVMGNRMYKKMSEKLDIPYLPCGGMVVATNNEEELILSELLQKALTNGLTSKEAYLISRTEILKKEPNISDSVTKALYLPTTAVTFPWEVAIANIENAMDNGVELKLETEVTDIKKDKHFTVTTTNGTFQSKVVINASGIHGEKVSNLFYKPEYTITPRRGEYFVLDKNSFKINNVIYPCPSERGKGVVITPQYHGNVLLGPTSEFVTKDEVGKTTISGLSYVKKYANLIVKGIPYQKVIRSFAGGRASSSTRDFIIKDVKESGFINVTGIESPGLSAAPAIAEYVVEKLVSKHINLTKNINFKVSRRKVIRTNELTNIEINNLVKENPLYGKLICRCEKLTEGEIIDSIHRNCGARSVTGVKNRTRAGAGRCQGGFCQPEIIRILARELKIDQMKVNYSKTGSYILKSRTKGESL
ncbi:NAD(P)/FAD-dependent oxidoreductase [Mycoplasmatota bacterium WC30]